MGPNFAALLSDPQYIQVILTSQKFIEKAEFYNLLKPWLNEGLLISTGSKWRQRRKIIAPAFHFKSLEEHVKIFDRQSTVFVDILSKYKTADKVELLQLIEPLALDIIYEAASGIELNAQRNYNSDYVTAAKLVCKIFTQRILSGVYCSDTIFRFSPLYKPHKDGLKVIHAFTDRVIQERQQELVAQRNKNGNAVDKESTECKTFLDILLEANIDGKPLSNLDIREEVDTFMVEGHGTSSSALTFCFYVLAKYPDIQQKCFQEMKNILGDDCSKAVTCYELNDLRYLDLVIKEQFRLYPPAPLMGRILREELTIGKYTYPIGTSIGFSPLLLGRDPKIFENPLVFRPERFLEDTTSDKFNFSYIPFSAGPRVGQKFAVLEVKAVVSKVLRRFEITLAEDSKSEPVITGYLILSARDPINYHLKPRMY